MSERQNIAAFTEMTHLPESYPAFVSINREADGRIVITARERGNGGARIACVQMDKPELKRLAYQILSRIDEVCCRCADDQTGMSSCPACDPGGA